MIMFPEIKKKKIKNVKIPNKVNKGTKYPSKHKLCYVPLAPGLQILLECDRSKIRIGTLEHI